jgi:hypothetical protein
MIPTPTQAKYPLRATGRTLFQAVIGLAAAAPILVLTSGTAQLWGIPTLLAASATITRIMAIPGVNLLLSSYGLGAEPTGRHAKGL